MSRASAYPPTPVSVAYRGSAATATLPTILRVGFGSVSREDVGRPNLLLGASLLSDDPLFTAFFQGVKALQEDKDEDAPPDSKALAEVLRLVPFSRNQLAQRWMAPRVASDGFGGVRLTWQRGQAEVRAVISGAQTARGSYLYWEDGGDYGTVPNFTAATLFHYLDHYLGRNGESST